MSNSNGTSTILSILAVAAVAATVVATPVLAGQGGGGGGEPGGSSRLTVKKRDGSSTTIKSRNGSSVFTKIKRNKNGKVVSKRVKRKKSHDFVTVHNPDGSSRTIRRNCQGCKVIIHRDKKGKTTKVVRVPKNRSSWASSTDPKTGKTRVSGRTAEGKRFSFSLNPFGIFGR